MTDCLIIGFNDSDLDEYVAMVKSMGADSGAYKDLDLALIDLDGKLYRSMDVLNRYYFEGRSGRGRPFHNADFLWPVVLYLGTFLSRRGFSFDYVNLFHEEKEKLREKLLREDILTIAITTTLYVSPHPILEIMSFIRKYNQTAKVILGGPYIANQTKMVDPLSVKHLFDLLGADFYVISQEGENALVNLIGALKSGSGLDQVENIAYKSGNRYLFTPTSVESNRLEENMVDYQLFPPAEIDQFISLRTAKSCPFACAFCGFPERAGKYTYQGVDLVEKELSSIRDMGTVTTLTFLDDTFNVPKARFKDILRAMIENRYGFKWNCFYRCDHGDEETIELMGRAGCEGVFLGVESGSDSMLERMNKTARRVDYMRALPLLKAAGISTYASLIVGFPGETAETVAETIAFIEEAAPDFYRAQLWYADPITPIWRQRDEYSIKGAAFNWSHATMDSVAASAYIDRIFLCIENSVWLPQLGFEQWSTFYLQRRGMSMERLKTFLKCFNAVKREQMLYPDRKRINPRLLESLKTSCRFEEAQVVDLSPVDALSGARYVASENYWIDELSTNRSRSNAKSTRTKDVEHGKRRSLQIELNGGLLKSLAEKYPGQLCEVILAAYTVLLSQLEGQKELILALTISEGEGSRSFPIKIEPVWSSSFSDCVEDASYKIKQGRELLPLPMHLLPGAQQLARKPVSRPVFDAALVMCESSSREASEGWLEALDSVPNVGRSLSACLAVVLEQGRMTLEFSHTDADADAFEGFPAYLTGILEEVAKNDGTIVGEVSPRVAPSGRSEPGDAGEVFRF